MEVVVKAGEVSEDSELGEVYRRNDSFVAVSLYKMGVSTADLPDATQDVFVVAHRKWSEFRFDARVSTWLYAIALRVASDYRRRSKRAFVSFGSFGNGIEVARESHEGPDECAAYEERVKRIESLVDALSRPVREVFLLHVVRGVSIDEVARLVSSPPKTVYARLYAARRILEEKQGVLWSGSLPDWWAAAIHALPALSTLGCLLLALANASGIASEARHGRVGATPARPLITMVVSTPQPRTTTLEPSPAPVQIKAPSSASPRPRQGAPRPQVDETLRRSEPAQPRVVYAGQFVPSPVTAEEWLPPRFDPRTLRPTLEFPHRPRYLDFPAVVRIVDGLER